MTEDEAKTKWCVNSPPVSNAGFYCEGSKCMAWRWLPLMADEAFKAAVIKAAADIGDTTENKHKAAKHVTMNRDEYGLSTKPFDGFYGMADQP
jgi:hypothetical protein